MTDSHIGGTDSAREPHAAILGTLSCKKAIT